jgi:hypothetical protein
VVEVDTRKPVCYNVITSTAWRGVATVKWNGLQVYVIIGVFLLGTALIFGVQNLVDRYEVKAPLIKSAERVDGVVQAELQKGKKGTDLVVSLKAPQDFRDSYGKLQSILGRYLGNDAGSVIIKDSRTRSLQRSYESLQFILQEGIATGRFAEMRAAFNREAQALGLTRHQVFVDSDHVYVAVEGGNGRLFDVINRPTTGLTSTAGNAQQGGGSADA